MKFYTITVNGNTYNVSVEEGLSAEPNAAPAPSAAPAPAAAPVASPAPDPAATSVAPVSAPNEKLVAANAPASVDTMGSNKINSPMPGKIVSIKANVGQALKKGDVILILEAMKMENEIVAPQDGTVASIHVFTGQSVEAGTLLSTLN